MNQKEDNCACVIATNTVLSIMKMVNTLQNFAEKVSAQLRNVCRRV